MPGLLPLLLSPRGRRQRAAMLDPAALGAPLTIFAGGRRSGRSSSPAATRLCWRRAASPRSSQRSRRSRIRRHPFSHPRAGGRSQPRRAALIKALAAEKALWVVVHANHPRELTPAAKTAVARLSAPAFRCCRRPCCCAGSTTTRRCSRPCSAASWRCGSSPITCTMPTSPGHGAFPHRHRRGAGPGALAARPGVGIVPADLHPRHPRRPREGADRPLCDRCGRRLGRMDRRGQQRRPPHLSAGLR